MANPIFFGSQQFHSLYRNCFDDLNPFDYSQIKNVSLYRDIQKELQNLILTNSDKQILVVANKIRSLFINYDGPTIGMFSQFKTFSAKVQNGTAFWGYLAPTLPLDNNKSIQNVFIKRIKELQEDFKKVLGGKSMDLNEKSLKASLGNPNFFDTMDEKSTRRIEKQPTVTSAANPNGEIIYQDQPSLEYGGIEIRKAGYNVFSDEAMEKHFFYNPAIIRELKSLRQYYIDEALAGKIIWEKVQHQESNGRVVQTLRIPFQPTDKDRNAVMLRYVSTMQYLIYHGIQNKTIRSMNEASVFVQSQLLTNSIFLSAYVHLNEEELKIMSTGCIIGINPLKHLFPKEET